VAETTTTVLEQDYRWAIEQGDVQAFVFPNYTSATNFWTRELIGNTSVSASMDGRNSVLEGPVTSYPALGRVWELRSGANNGFPTLVWEQAIATITQDTPAAPGVSSSPATPTAATPTAATPTAATPTAAAPAVKLAATGTDLAPISLGVTSALLILGLMLLTVSKRLRRKKL
jgi:hypothetical protein